eukprot:4097684-Pyramimonas_sp.AAC.1
MAWKAFAKFKRVLCSPVCPLSQRMRSFDSAAAPAAMRGCERWTMGEAASSRFKVTWSKCFEICFALRVAPRKR